MSSGDCSESSSAGGKDTAAAGQGALAGLRVGVGGGGQLLHPRPFKLRFATRRDLGRSNISPAKPLGLPSTVTGKFYTVQSEGMGEEEEERERCALGLVERLMAGGPRAALAQPRTAADEYGWWSREGAAVATTDGADPAASALRHPLRDSAWLKCRVALLAHQNTLKHK